MTVPELLVEDVRSGYGRGFDVLQGVTLRAEPGSVVAVLGPNGAGKTTLLRTVAGDPRPRTGVVKLGGLRISGMSADAIARAGIRYVPQGRRLFPYLTVEDNLRVGALHARAGGNGLVEALRRELPILEEKWHALAGSLSGGQQQVVAIARGLAAVPRVLLLDEPSMGLSPALVSSIGELIRTTAARTTVVLAEQDVALGLRLADEVYVLHRGNVVTQGSPAEVYGDPLVRKAYLGVSDAVESVSPGS